jgi:hypothetical protein
MTFKEFMAARKRSFQSPFEDFRTYIISDPLVPDFTERGALEMFLKKSSSVKIRLHSVVADQAWQAYEAKLHGNEGHRRKNRAHAA